MRYALVDAAGVVVNVIEWDGDTSRWAPPAGHTAVRDTSGTAMVGGTWDGATFSAAPPPEPLPDAPAFAAAVTQLRNTYGTTRTAAQVNKSIDALTVVLRRVFRELAE